MLTKVFSTLTILFLLFLIIFRYIKNTKYYKQASLIPTLKTYPIIGNVHMLLGKSNIEIYYDFVENYLNKYPSLLGFWVFHKIWIFVYKPEYIKIVLTSSKALEKGSWYKKTIPVFGNGLISSPVPIWRVHRKLIQPSFHPKILRSFIDIFDKHSKILVEKLAEKANGEEFLVFPYIEALALNIACESTMGLSTHDRVVEKFGHNIDRLFEIYGQRVTSFWLYQDIIFKYTKLSRELGKHIKYLQDASSSIIQEKKKYATIETNETETNKRKIKPFIDLILELQEEDKFTDEDVRDECLVMISAASDTISKSLQFTLLTLATRPDIQDKIYEELKDIFYGQNPENISFTSENLQKMEYLERVIKESLRLFPAAPTIIRKVQEDISCDNYTFPQGTELVIPISYIHRNAIYWPDPLRFDPDRFLPEEVAKRHPYTYIPFSAGPRNCIGHVYAMMEMKIVLTRILFKLILKKENPKPIKDIKFKFSSIITPSESISIRIENRMNR